MHIKCEYKDNNKVHISNNLHTPTHTHTCPRTFTRQLSMLTSCTVRYDKHLGGPALQHKQLSAEKSGIYKKRCSNFRRPAGAAVRCKPVSSQLEPPCAAGAVMMTQRERELMWTMRKLQLRGLDNQAADAHINIHTDTWFAENWGERVNKKEIKKPANDECCETLYHVLLI